MIQTVTGEIRKTEETDVILMHEHISCSSLSYKRAFGTEWLDRNQLKSLAVETMKLLKEKYNLGLMVDGTPIDVGRDATLLKEIAEQSGVKIVASTGLYYLHSIETTNNTPDELAKWLIYECRNGIEGTGIKPGILKCATGELGITEDNKNKLSAMGIVQKETGLPMYVHCEHKNDIAHKQIEVLLENGADIEKIIIGHAAIRPDMEYLEKILEYGCYICMDQCHCYKSKITTIADTLVKLCKKGFTEKILISNDYCIHNDFCERDKNGFHLTPPQHAEWLGYIFDKLYQEYVSLGGLEKDWNTMLFANPIKVLDV